MRSPFDGPLVSNWEGIELILDYSFAKIGVDSRGLVNNPIVMSELMGCPASQRKSELFKLRLHEPF